MFDFFDVPAEYDNVCFPAVMHQIRDPMIIAESGMRIAGG
jgi:hypothetical protein